MRAASLELGGEVLKPPLGEPGARAHAPLLGGRGLKWLASVTAVDAGLEMDLLEDLETLKFESGIHEEDQSWLYLLGRSHGLMTKACAHATFFCKLLHNMRYAGSLGSSRWRRISLQRIQMT